MEWPQLIVALVLIAGYVIKHIISAQQEAAAQQEREKLRAAPQPAVTATSDDAAASERITLDRRIEEAVERRRERDETGEEARPSPVTVARHIPMAVPSVVVVPVPRYQPPAHD